MDLKEYVQKARKAKGLSQSALAEKVDVSASFICKLEHDRLVYPPTTAVLAKIAEVLEVDMDMLTFLAGRTEAHLPLLEALIMTYPAMPRLLRKLYADKAYATALITSLD